MKHVTCNKFDIATLGKQIETWVKHGFPLGHDGTIVGKHHKHNYKSSIQYKEGTHKSLLKRLAANKTAGPYEWSGNVADLPFENCAINPLGAVPYKYEPSRARACDDPIINDAIPDTPTFKMSAIQQLRDGAFPYCYWLKSDVASAFLCMHLQQKDLPWMIFSWYRPDDTNFQGTDQDCLYVHTHGNFGPRPWPYEFTMLMLYVNIACKTLGIPIPPAFIDDNIHCGTEPDLTAMAPSYYKHLDLAGLTDKEQKRELLPMVGEILGVWFDSIRMTLSIPQDKVTRLQTTMQQHIDSKRISLTEIMHLLGYWEFCVALLPKFMRAFSFTSHIFKRVLSKLPKNKQQWIPKRMRKDLQTILQLLPTVNCTVPLQPMHGRVRADPACTDACGGKKSAGAWVTPTGFEWWPYTGKEKKAIIAWQEGEAVHRYIRKNTAQLSTKIAPIHIDNTTFLGALRRGFSTNRKICDLVQRILLLCYEHDIYLDLYYISSADNILADAASRQYWETFTNNFYTFYLFADSRAHRLSKAQQPTDKSQCNIDILPARVQFAVRQLEASAYEDSTRDGAATAWTYWERYIEECNTVGQTSLWQDPNSKQGKIYLAGFKAALAHNLCGSHIAAAGTVTTYSNQVIWILKQHQAHQLNRAVTRGVAKTLQDGRRYQGSLDLTFFATLYSKVEQLPEIQSTLKLVRNLLVYSFLGFSISRSQSAVIKKVQRLQNSERILMRRDVRLDNNRHAVWWALKYSKGDPFGLRKGKDRKDWTVTAGTTMSPAGGKKKVQHPICIVKLFKLYCRLMDFDPNSQSRKSYQQAEAPFFQELDPRGKPTGKPLTYDTILYALKADIKTYFPHLDPKDYATHSFRRFGATYGKTHGIPDDLVQYMGRWVSDCFQRYWIFDDDAKVDMSRSLVP